ncbi:hypothetical protein G6F42_027542 [Rhizopus arrhizus]|nr:hypothetical protein G6F42_027542 [Rhizopus arrhizus]
MYTGLPHKVLLPEKFNEEVAKLRTRFNDPQNADFVFKPEYHKRIPADGYHIYASGIWDKVLTNKDLDLPTQQELLAQYRCDEISGVSCSISDCETFADLYTILRLHLKYFPQSLLLSNNPFLRKPKPSITSVHKCLT